MCVCVFMCVYLCVCVCARAHKRVHEYALRIVSMDEILHFTNTLIIIINNGIYAQHIHDELLMGPMGWHITAEPLLVSNRIPRPQSTFEQWPMLSTYTMSCCGNRTAVTSPSSISWCLTGIHLALFSPYTCHTIANKNCMSYDS